MKRRRIFPIPSALTTLTLLAGGAALVLIFPPLAPILGVAAMIAGNILYRRSDDPLSRSVSEGFFIAGVILLLVTALFLVYRLPSLILPVG